MQMPRPQNNSTTAGRFFPLRASARNSKWDEAQEQKLTKGQESEEDGEQAGHFGSFWLFEGGDRVRKLEASCWRWQEREQEVSQGPRNISVLSFLLSFFSWLCRSLPRTYGTRPLSCSSLQAFPGDPSSKVVRERQREG